MRLYDSSKYMLSLITHSHAPYLLPKPLTVNVSSAMSDSVIDRLFEDPVDLPTTDLDFFLDQIPIDDVSTFTVVSPFSVYKTYCNLYGIM